MSGRGRDLEFLIEWSNGKIDAQTTKSHVENDPQCSVRNADHLQRMLFPAKTTCTTFRQTVKTGSLEG